MSLERRLGHFASILPRLSAHAFVEDGEQAAFAAIRGVDVWQLRQVDWSDCVVERCSFVSATVADSTFERTLFTDCDCSGLTFANCLLRDCVFVGVKSVAHLALDNCVLDGVTIVRSRLDRLELLASRIADFECALNAGRELRVSDCTSPKRRAGRVVLQDSRFARLTGLDTLGAAGVSVHMDAVLWRALGDQLLAERGFAELDNESRLSERALDACLGALVGAAGPAA